MAVFYHAGSMEQRALVVCPDQDSGSLLALLLSEMEMTAEHTSSISRGMELLDSQRFDAIVLDYRADESSEEFTAHWRQSAKNWTTMLIAVVDGEYDARLVFILGASFVLYRPLSSERTCISLRAARSLLGRERRRAPRTPVGSAVNVACPGAPETNAVLSDLSEGGSLIQTANRLPSDHKVYFEFALPGQPQPVRLSGEVAWQDSSGRTGIRFLDVPQASRRIMQTWLQRNSPSRASEPAKQTAAETRSVIEHTAEPQFEIEPTDSTVRSGDAERRGDPRYACTVGAELHSAGTAVPNFCSLSDISAGGCYVEMPIPLVGEPSVEILVRTGDEKFKLTGQVLSSHPGFGMGVRFVLRDSGDRKEVMRLLAVLSAGSLLDEPVR